MKHSRFKELFTGRRNIFTALAVAIGGYFIAYPLVLMTLESFGKIQTMIIGLIILVTTDYLIDAFHEHDKKS